MLGRLRWAAGTLPNTARLGDFQDNIPYFPFLSRWQTPPCRHRTAELRQEQAFTQAVLENINDGIVACDRDGRLSFFNRATRQIHGID